MSTPYLSEIRLMSFGFAPDGWALCNGQLLPINQHQALFSIIGIIFGGDGIVSFGLPDLRGRVPVHKGTGFEQGQRGGSPTHTLVTNQLPAHTHNVYAAASAADAPLAANAFLAQTLTHVYASPAGNTILHPNSMTTAVGNSAPHNNMQPFLTLSFCIALTGIYPSPG